MTAPSEYWLYACILPIPQTWTWCSTVVLYARSKICLNAWFSINILHLLYWYWTFLCSCVSVYVLFKNFPLYNSHQNKSKCFPVTTWKANTFIIHFWQKLDEIISTLITYWCEFPEKAVFFLHRQVPTWMKFDSVLSIFSDMHFDKIVYWWYKIGHNVWFKQLIPSKHCMG